MHPPRNLPEGFTSKGYVNFSPLLPALNEARSFEQLQVLGHSVERRIERLRDIEKSRRSVCQLPNNGSPSRVRNGRQHISQLIHKDYYTIRCNISASYFSPRYLGSSSQERNGFDRNTAETLVH